MNRNKFCCVSVFFTKSNSYTFSLIHSTQTKPQKAQCLLPVTTNKHSKECVKQSSYLYHAD